MNHNKILQRLEEGQLDASSAYDELYEPTIKESGKRAFFVKMNISVPDESKGVNTFLRILFLIPIPLIFARIALRIMGSRINKHIDNPDFNVNDILTMIKYSKHTRIQIESKDATINIKVI